MWNIGHKSLSPNNMFVLRRSVNEQLACDGLRSAEVQQNKSGRNWFDIAIGQLRGFLVDVGFPIAILRPEMCKNKVDTLHFIKRLLTLDFLSSGWDLGLWRRLA